MLSEGAMLHSAPGLASVNDLGTKTTKSPSSIW